MSEFKKFNEDIQQQFKKMTASGMILFRSKRTGREVWSKYLESFEDGDDPVFRDPQSTSHTCNNCGNFIRRYGNIIAVSENGEILSLFGDLATVGLYQNVADKLEMYISDVGIKDVFFESFIELNTLPYERNVKQSQAVFRLGVSNDYKQYTKEEALAFGVVKEGEIRTFHHFHIDMPKRFIIMGNKSVERITGEYRDKYNVFKRAMVELSIDTLNLVKDLINQGSLLDGTSHLEMLKLTIIFKKEYDVSIYKEPWLRVTSYRLNESVAKFKNTLMGTLCTELSEGMELNKACLNWNKRVDPANYHKATAPITKKQILEAQKFVEENGYTSAFKRRLAVIDDIKASEIKHINEGDGSIKEISIFDNVKATSTRHKRNEFDNVEEVSIEKFMTDILPGCTSIEVFLKNIHENNLVTLTTSVEKEIKQIFKWNNSYSWTFNGNLAGKSQIKQAVKDAGGNVDGVLNFRLAWNDSKERDDSDLDAWCIEPNDTCIGYSTKYRADKGRNNRTSMSGQLDVDNTNPNGELAVENITWIDKSKMKDGVYKLWVNQYCAKNSQGFKAEIEFDGDIYTYEYNKAVKGDIQVVEVILKNGNFTINHKLPETNLSKELWGLETNIFHKVNLICLSPNHWDENAVGNKHYMFMLNKCKNEDDVRGFHNENLTAELLEHRKVLEVLGNTSMIPANDVQLSGLGFNSTVKDELIVKCSGTFKRMLKIKF